MTLRKAVVGAAACATLLPVSAAAEAEIKREYNVQLTRNLVYGRAPIDASKDRPRERDLLVDVYRPVAGGKPLANRPAVIMAFGGAFHRGDKGEAHFTEDGAQDSRSEEPTSELQSHMRISYAGFCLNKTKLVDIIPHT